MSRSVEAGGRGGRPGAVRVAERELDPRTVEVAVAGELDLANAPQLKWALLDSLRLGKTNLVVNLAQVTFIDSTALSVLVSVKRRLTPSAAMALVCTSEPVLRIISIAGLDGLFDIFPTPEAAHAHLAGSRENPPADG